MFLGAIKKLISRRTETQHRLFQEEFAKTWAEATRPRTNVERPTMDEAFLLALGRDAAEALFRESRAGERACPLAESESGAATVLYPKVSAILFDRVWSNVALWEPNVPMDVLFRSGSRFGVGFMFSDAVRAAVAPDLSFIRSELKQNADHWELLFPKELRELQARVKRPIASVFGKRQSFSKAYESGSHEVLAAALTNLPFIDERQLEWQQVMEIRQDREAKTSIRSFLKWADVEFVGKTPVEIGRAITDRYEAYAAALHKHGIKKTVATLESLLDIRSKLGAAGAVTILPALGFHATASAITALSIGVADCALSLTKKLIDLSEEQTKLHKEHAEVAFLAALDR